MRLPLQILFLTWVSSIEHYWVILAERRGLSGVEAKHPGNCPIPRRSGFYYESFCLVPHVPPASGSPARLGSLG